ncbi:MAG: triacylglycerol lipase [Mycobacterium sp.]|nr:triacylglycerol lipase [Mycobacterium sp.]
MSQALVHNRHQSARVGARRRRDVAWPLGAIGGARTLFRIVGRAALVQTYEVALMASLAATVPLHLAGDRFDAGVSAPAKSHSAPTARPVLLVHGLGGTKSSWSFLARTLTARGLTVDAITYSPFGTSVEQVADRLAIKVERLLSQTGADKVHLVGHSLGGVVIAQAIANGRLTGLVDTVVTLAAPFGGSPWANLLPFRGDCLGAAAGFAPAAKHRLRSGTRTTCAGWHSRRHTTRSCPAAGRCHPTST